MIAATRHVRSRATVTATRLVQMFARYSPQMRRRHASAHPSVFVPERRARISALNRSVERAGHAERFRRAAAG